MNYNDFKRIAGVTNAVQDLAPSGANCLGVAWYGVLADNGGNAAVVYLQLFKAKAADVVLGTTVPDFVLPLQPNTVQNGIVDFKFNAPLDFVKGFSGAITAGKTNNTAPPTTGVDITTYVQEK